MGGGMRKSILGIVEEGVRAPREVLHAPAHKLVLGTRGQLSTILLQHVLVVMSMLLLDLVHVVSRGRNDGKRAEEGQLGPQATRLCSVADVVLLVLVEGLSLSWIRGHVAEVFPRDRRARRELLQGRRVVRAEAHTTMGRAGCHARSSYERKHGGEIRDRHQEER